MYATDMLVSGLSTCTCVNVGLGKGLPSYFVRVVQYNMPKRTRVDDDRVLAVFTETRDRYKTARILGICKSTVDLSLRRSNGICVRCTHPAEAGRQMCW